MKNKEKKRIELTPMNSDNIYPFIVMDEKLVRMAYRGMGVTEKALFYRKRRRGLVYG